jgi:hypothetical protein
MGLVVAVPELIAAVDKDAVGFPTISETTGHLEFRWSFVALVVIVLIVFAVFCLLRFPPGRAAAAEAAGEDHGAPGRSLRRTGRGARLTARGPAQERKPGAGSPPAGGAADEVALDWLPVGAIASFLLIIAATLAVAKWGVSGDPEHFHTAYTLYGLIALFWIAIPTILAFGWAREVPFPTLFRTVQLLEQRTGSLVGTLIAFLILAGLTILVVHLILYPFPDITRIINPKGG